MRSSSESSRCLRWRSTRSPGLPRRNRGSPPARPFWSRAAASPGPRWRPRGCSTGPPSPTPEPPTTDALRKLVASGSELVVTDGNRRRATAVTIGRPIRSPTLAAGETTDRAPQDLFGSPETQSVATYADARRIFASRSGNELEAPYDPKSRPANAFDRVERTAWQVRGPGDPTGESVTVEFREPVAVTAVSVLPYADGTRTVKAVDVIAHSEDGEATRKRLRFEYPQRALALARFEPTEVSAIEIRIARVVGGTGAVGITEAAIGTPNGQLDLREFVRTPDDLAMRAASDDRLGAALAARPPRYELRRITGVGAQQPSFAAQDEETELRREITAFGDHRYELGMTARIDSRAADSAIDALLGAPVGAVGTSRFGGDVERRGGLVVDDDLSTGWEPELLRGQRVDLRFPTTEVRTVEVLVVSGPRRALAGHRHRGRGGRRGDDIGRLDPTALATVHAPQASRRRLSRNARRPRAPHRYGPPLGHIWPGLESPGRTIRSASPESSRGAHQRPRLVGARRSARPERLALPCSRSTGTRSASGSRANPHDVLAGRLLELEGCEPIRLGPGRHRIETLPGLSGAVLTASLVPLDEQAPR